VPRFSDEQLTRALYRQASPLGEERVGGVVVSAAPPITYGREFYPGLEPFIQRVEVLQGRGLANNASVLVVGCGFGFLIERLITAGVTGVWGVEPGAWYWDPANDGEWAPGIKARVADDWVGSGTVQSSLVALGGVSGQARFGWVVDEDAVTMHSDAELPAFLAGCEARLQGNARGRIVHLVTPVGDGGPGDSAVNWKTLAEWKAVEPAHTWVHVGTGEVA